MSTNPVIAGNQNPLAPDTLGLPVVNIPGMQLPTTADVLNNIPGSGVAKPGHFAQLIVDGPSVFNGAVYFGASQHAAWFDCSPATVDPTVVLDFAGGPQQYLFLTRDTIIWLPTTDQQEGMFFVLVEQALSGPWLLTWKINNPTTDGSAVVIWLAGEEPVMSSAAGSVRLYTFTWCQNLNGGLGAYVGSSTADLATLGFDADIATLSLPANTTITTAAQTILDDTTVAAILATLGAVAARIRTNWNDGTVIDKVLGLLSWKNYGNGHVIFDASGGLSPDGGAISSVNAQNVWVATFPTLMGWNGSQTYGVRVDCARVADSAPASDVSAWAKAATRGITTGTVTLSTTSATMVTHGLGTTPSFVGVNPIDTYNNPVRAISIGSTTFYIPAVTSAIQVCWIAVA